MRGAGLKVEIGPLKALLKELGYNWNGPSCSLSHLLQNLKGYLNPHLAKSELRPPTISQARSTAGRSSQKPPDHKTLWATKLATNGAKSLLEVVKDLFYCSRKTLYEIWREVAAADGLDTNLFSRLVYKYSNGVIAGEEADQVFREVCSQYKQQGAVIAKDFLSWREFETAFTVVVPNTQAFKDEQRVLQAVKDWMNQRGYAPEAAFERMLHTTRRVESRTLRRYDLHKALTANEVALTSPEIDYLFDQLTGHKNLSSTLLGVR